MIPTSIDGTDITGATIDGTDVQEITVDGQTVFSAGPSNGVYLDDFADGKLSSRDSYSDTGLTPASLEPASSDFGPPVRPEWTPTGSPNVVNSKVELDGGDSVVTTLTQIDLTWEWDVFFPSGADNFRDNIVANTTTRRGPGQNLEDGYFMFIADTTASGLFVDVGGSITRLLGFPVSNGPETFTVRVENDFDAGTGQNNFEVFKDGVSQGTVSDSTFTTNSFFAFTSQVGTNSTRDNLRVF